MDICKDNDFCGGCIYQGTDYSEQLKIKEKEVLDLLAKRKVRYDSFCEIEGSPQTYRYRNKMEYTFGDLVKDGEMTLGMHKKGNFMSIVTVDECQLVHEDFNRILRATLDFCISEGYEKYHKKSHKGLLRNLIIRRGENTNQILVNIVTTTQSEFDEDAYVSCIQSLDLESELCGVLRTLDDDIADAVKCDSLKILWGKDYYMERIMGLDFKVSAFSFFQTNVKAVERLYSYALSLIDNFEGKTAFDLYCGTGTITQTLALKAKKAIGIEIVGEAVDSARENAELNGLDNCEFIAGDVFEKLDEVKELPDVIVVDPPRMGIQPKALDKIISYGVDQILYISCNPKTLAENLFYLEYYGYHAVSVKPFDNFPNTRHVETVCLLSNTHKKKESCVTLDVEMDDYYRIRETDKKSGE